MAAELEVGLDPTSLRKFRRLLTASRTEAAKALTFTAEKAKPAWIAENRRVFHMRRAWLDKGVRMQAATPSRLEARIGSLDRFLGRHVKGLDEEKRGSGRLLVPTYKNIADVPVHTVIRRRLRQAAGTKRAPFLMRLNSGDEALVRRLGKGRTPLSFLAVLRSKVRIPRRFDAVGTVGRVVRTEFPTVYERLLLRWMERA